MLRKLTAFIGLAMAVVLLAGPAAPGQETSAQKGRKERLAKGKKDEKPKDRIKFHAVMGDPFADANAAGGKGTVARGSVFTVAIIGELAPGYYTYPLLKKAPNQPKGQLAKIRIKAGKGLDPLEPWSESEPTLVAKDGESEYHFEGPFEFRQDVFVNEDAVPGSTVELVYTLNVQVCTKSCYLEKRDVKFAVTIGPEPFAAPPIEIDQRERSPTASEAAALDGPGERRPPTLLGAVLVAIMGGFVSLLTPCVFPMIPVTVSIFLHESKTKHENALLLAGVYSGTIVLVMALGGLLLLQFLSAVINHWVTNLLLGVVFAYFALSLLGMYEITLPSWMQNLTHSGEGQGGYAGVFFMALTFSIISFACVGPIYGAFLSAEAAAGATGGMVRRVASVLAFSLAFASPFFLLALFPAWLKSLPRAGNWMNSVKVVMGFLELAAMVKFLRGAELLFGGQTTILTYQVSMGLYVALCLGCGLYLFGLYRLPHDHQAPETISVPRLMFAIVFVTLGFYLTPGVFPLKDEDIPSRGKVYAWVDSFLLPDPKKGEWMSDLDAALARARTQGKLVFLDITGVNCTNCKLNERNIFPRPEVKAAFYKHVLLKLYTDVVPAGTAQSPSAADAIALRTGRFNSEALPLYALLRPTDDGFEIVGRFADDGNGLINDADVPAFVKFLAR